MGPVLRRKAAHAMMPAKRFHGGTMDGEDVTVRGVIGGLAVGVVQNLHLNGPQEGHTGPTDGGSPDKDTGVTGGLEVAPVQFEDEILILPHRAERANRFACAVDQAVGDRPRLRRTVHIDPASQVLAIEQGTETIGIGFDSGAGRLAAEADGA